MPSTLIAALSHEAMITIHACMRGSNQMKLPGATTATSLRNDEMRAPGNHRDHPAGSGSASRPSIASLQTNCGPRDVSDSGEPEGGAAE